MKNIATIIGRCMQNRVSHIAGLRYASARRLVSPPPQKAAAPPVPAAGASAQKVAPPNLVLPADMGGGTRSQHYGTPEQPGPAGIP
jgi:hypothetical protein